MSKNDLNEDVGFFDGFTIHDCVILSKGYYGVSAEEILSEEEFDYYESRGQSQVGSYSDDRQEEGKPPIWGGIVWPRHSFFNTRLVNTEYKECLMMDDAGQGYYLGLGDNKFAEKQLSPKTRFHQLAKVEDQVYGVGWGREVFKRLGPENWQCISEQIREHGNGHGFEDMDGFSKNDLYAVGGTNDVWHFDGEQWRYIDVCDEQMLPLSVCCAEDGYVYIGCAWGIVLRGRGEEWDVFHTDKNIKFCDTVAYKGRVFFGSESGVFVSQQNTEAFSCQPYDFEGQIAPLNARRLDAGHGLLLAASLNSVALYDGENWQYLYGGGPTPKEEALLLEMLAREAEQDLDELTELADQLKPAKGQG
ncbi:hypothetical protein [Marinomonas fungiae]|uniref:hypothetical protein n=1 Tax=Marinomonas fungiae TaxID=1137284 RepID=UPI003A93EB7A